jgi:hypothetical protein
MSGFHLSALEFHCMVMVMVVLIEEKKTLDSSLWANEPVTLVCFGLW